MLVSRTQQARRPLRAAAAGLDSTAEIERMGGLLFVSQAALDSWAGQGKIDFVGNVMTLLVGEGRGRSYALDPAVRFLAVVGADADPHGLLRKVKSAAQLAALGADQVGDSVLIGDVAYQVEPGFLAEVSALRAAAAPPAPRAPAAPLPRELEEKRKEAEALARFLLENLS